MTNVGASFEVTRPVIELYHAAQLQPGRSWAARHRSLISVQFEALSKGLMPLYEPAEAFIGGHRVPCVSTVAQPGPGPQPYLQRRPLHGRNLTDQIAALLPLTVADQRERDDG